MTDSIETSEAEACEVDLQRLIKLRKEQEQTEHREFEQWYLSVGGHPNNLLKSTHGDYVYVNQEWQAWCGRAALCGVENAKLAERNGE